MNSNSSDSTTNALIELRHIQIELQNRRAQHFRHFVDHYYCYTHGHIKRTGAADWESIVWTGHVSRMARQCDDRKLVVKEHVVPLSVIRGMLVALSRAEEATLDRIAKLLDENVRFATITKEEDGLLRRSGLTSKMPDGFLTPGHKFCGDLFARYKQVGIEMN